jgi:hypothetical protein
VGPGPHVRDWAVVFDGDGEAHYRVRRFARGGSPSSHSETRTQLYDLWAQAPVS